MRSPLQTWMVIGLLLSTTAYAIAEEMTLTTYYPSPHGVYRELRVGSGNALAPGAAVEITNNGGALSLQVDTAFAVAGNGNVGLGTINPGERLDVAGNGRISGTMNVGGTLAVTGDATFGSNVTVTGTLTDGTLTANAANTTITVLVVPGGSPGMVLSYDQIQNDGTVVWDYPKYAP